MTQIIPFVNYKSVLLSVLGAVDNYDGVSTALSKAVFQTPNNSQTCHSAGICFLIAAK
ncbi:hypothetical protein [Flavobacterium aestuarii]|uniref:hypothetical protein n=1 Tax=Flavobacterium aestuarii TaxID=3149227 RepID=UPI0032B5C4CB